MRTTYKIEKTPNNRCLRDASVGEFAIGLGSNDVKFR